MSWDELSTDERPPKRIWRDGSALKEWFEDVTAARKAQYGPDPRREREIEDPRQNEAAKGLIVG